MRIVKRDALGRIEGSSFEVLSLESFADDLRSALGKSGIIKETIHYLPESKSIEHRDGRGQIIQSFHIVHGESV